MYFIITTDRTSRPNTAAALRTVVPHYFLQDLNQMLANGVLTFRHTHINKLDRILRVLKKHKINVQMVATV